MRRILAAVITLAFLLPAALSLGAEPIHTNYDAAAAKAKAEDRPLVIWFGVEPEDHPDTLAGLPAAVHVSLDPTTRTTDKRPRLVFQDAAGRDLFVLATDIDPTTAADIRSHWRPKHQSGERVEAKPKATETVKADPPAKELETCSADYTIAADPPADNTGPIAGPPSVSVAVGEQKTIDLIVTSPYESAGTIGDTPFTLGLVSSDVGKVRFLVTGNAEGKGSFVVSAKSLALITVVVTPAAPPPPDVKATPVGPIPPPADVNPVQPVGPSRPPVRKAAPPPTVPDRQVPAKPSKVQPVAGLPVYGQSPGGVILTSGPYLPKAYRPATAAVCLTLPATTAPTAGPVNTLSPVGYQTANTFTLAPGVASRGGMATAAGSGCAVGVG